ncbi:MAG: serine/threonine protein kinase, partial [Myxococcales bacterium]|nr:serine/threonine protein kinase [Myxococcales bacterium]
MGAETEPRSGEDASAPTTIGRYRVLRRIGAGGMGVVYAAYDNELDRKIAVKLVARGAGKDGGGLRLVREAQAMARVSHPNVINVYDAGTFGRFVFVAMEYVDGHTLAERMAKRPGWREVLEVFRAAGRGLAGAHEAGLIHRDFKPENVMITRRGRVVVLDFGLARPRDATPETSPAARGPGDEPAPALTRSVGETTALEASLTRTGALMGTPAYMAPEQMRGQPLDARSDQF